MTDATPTAEREQIARIIHEHTCLSYHRSLEGKAHTWERCPPDHDQGGKAIAYRAADALAECLAAHAAQAVESYRNALTAMEAHLEPEWSEARAEVLAEGNAGWTMMAKLAIEKRAAQAVAEERERCLAAVQGYFTGKGQWLNDEYPMVVGEIAAALRAGQPGKESAS